MKFLIIPALLLFSSNIFAQSETDRNSTSYFKLKNFELNFGVNYSTMNLDTEYCERNGIGDRSHGFMFVVEPHLFKYFLVGFDMGGEFISDSNAFTNETTDGTKVSTARLMRGSYYFGLASPFIKISPRLAIQPMLKYGNQGLSGTRTIDNCPDCDEKFFEAPSTNGNFIEPSLMVYLGWYYGLGINAAIRTYPSGSDVNSTILIGFSTRLSYLKRY